MNVSGNWVSGIQIPTVKRYPWLHLVMIGWLLATALTHQKDSQARIGRKDLPECMCVCVCVWEREREAGGEVEHKGTIKFLGTKNWNYTCVSKK